MQESHGENGNRSMREVERELTQSRAHLDRTLTELEHKFSRDYLKEYAGRRAGEALHATRQLLATYPVTSALAATIVVGALTGWEYRRRHANNDWSATVRRILEEGRRSTGSMDHARVLAKHAGQQAGHAARAFAHEAALQGGEALSRGKDYALRQASQVGDNLDLRGHQSLIGGMLLGIAFAALCRRVL